jgi:hypothetical protein
MVSPDVINPAAKYVVFIAKDNRQIKARLAPKWYSIGKIRNPEIALISIS